MNKKKLRDDYHTISENDVVKSKLFRTADKYTCLGAFVIFTVILLLIHREDHIGTVLATSTELTVVLAFLIFSSNSAVYALEDKV